MRNISFDNPWWLLILIPLLAGVLIPFCISIRRDNRSKGVIASFVIHLLIVVLVALGAAGTVITTVMTETHVYVLADVSYSATKSTEQINGYVSEIKESLPKNSKLGVVCFGKDHVLHNELGAALTDVSTATVDGSATDIASALEYTGSLFEEGVIKKIVLITDGKETVSENVSGMVTAVEKLVSAGVEIDAIYLDSNVTDDDRELQLTGVDYTGATYINHQTTADVLLQSSYETHARITVFRNGSKLTERTEALTRGYNVINFELPTDTAGSFDYEVRISSDGGDESPYNNSYSFTQTVSGEIKVLLIASEQADVTAAERLYGEKATLDVYLNNVNVPCSVEELCKYDEIMIANTDIRELNNVSAFIEGVETVVSKYGKSLVTVGDNKIQNKTDENLDALENMLPVKFGNNAQDPRLYAIVIDVSRSMYTASRLSVVKQAAIHLLTLLNDEDDVIIVTFAGDIKIVQPATKAIYRAEIAKKIQALQPSQGTSIGGGLKAAVSMMLAHEHDLKQVMLLSDGMNYTAERVEIDGVEMNTAQLAAYMGDNNIQISAMNPYNSDTLGIETLQAITDASGGKYYFVAGESDIEELVFSDVADDVTEAVVEKESIVRIERPKDDVMANVPYLPAVFGYVQSKAKISAQTVLTVDYEKASGAVTRVPLYAYWKYGNGRVSSFTGGISGSWAKGWQDGLGNEFLSNVLDVNVPEEKIDRPYTVSVEYDGIYSNVEILPAKADPYATVGVKVTYPDGTEISEQPKFNASGYSFRFETPLLGKYAVSITYSSGVGSYESESVFNISYSPEYDRFASFDASTLHAAIRHRGTVSEGGIPSLENEDGNVDTYRLTFTVPFMIAAVALFVLDVIVRKVKLSDIRTLLKISERKRG